MGICIMGNYHGNMYHGNMTVLSRGRFGLLGGGPGYGGPALLYTPDDDDDDDADLKFTFNFCQQKIMS